jgi:hypothetical protein
MLITRHPHSGSGSKTLQNSRTRELSESLLKNRAGWVDVMVIDWSGGHRRVVLT